MANSAEQILYNALTALGQGGVYPDVAPANAARPWFTYQAVGGQSVNQLDDVVALQNARVQVNAWATTRLEAVAMINAAIGALCPEPILATSLGAPVSTYEPDTKLYGSRIDFSIWFNP
ncbi:DUF3168 domain-containing protein [Paraburkholderia tuberum]|uniref:DUF3168 domain-containing protein n=1 Tax=Paraburkholderia tuberum TaxID=157910 RepID=A0A1H1JAT5_9BURK|nr:DUF3168 domain-containing protein [Paraburkholderia tuberum]SDR47105.1 Protein of unknown function [Paraburkholderia tuberum]